MSDENKKDKPKKHHNTAPEDLPHRPRGVEPQPINGTYYCQAKKKNGQICKSNKVLENGRCKFHGGMSSGRKDGTGLNAKIYSDMFTEEELQYLNNISSDDIVKQFDDEIDIAKIRQRRMLKKIQELKDQKWRDFEKKETVGQMGNQMVSNTETTSKSVEAFIMQLENDITKVQNQIMKLLNSKAQYMASINQDTQVDVSVFVNAVKQNTESLWEDDDNGDNEEDKG
jgi:hypothetical protein